MSWGMVMVWVRVWLRVWLRVWVRVWIRVWVRVKARVTFAVVTFAVVTTAICRNLAGERLRALPSLSQFFFFIKQNFIKNLQCDHIYKIKRITKAL